MASEPRDPRTARHDLISSVTALRLLVDGWRDGLVDARPGTGDGEQLHLLVRTLSDLVDRLTPVSDSRSSGGSTAD